jgi:ATP-binding cassette, subfamily B, bacterial
MRAFADHRDLLRRYLGAQRSAAVLMAFLLLCSIGLQLAGPRVLRAFLDAIKAGVPEQALFRLGLLFVLLAMATQAMRVMATFWSERVAWRAANALRADLAAHLLSLDPGFFKAHTPGELIERVDGDVSALAGFLSSFVVKLCGSVLLLSGVLVSLFLINSNLGLAFTLFAALAVAVLVRVLRAATPQVAQSREQSAQFYGYLGEVITAAEDIRSSGAVEHVMNGYWRRLRRWLPISVRAEWQGAWVGAAAMVAFALGDGLAYGLGGGLYRAEAISMGTVYMVVAYAGLLAQPLEMIRQEMQSLQRADAGIARIRELLALRSSLSEGTAALPDGPLSVDLQGVSFRYDDGDESVLHDLSLELAPGHSLGLLGRTGSGKSTLARLLFRLYDPQEGAVRLGGLDLRQARLQALRSRVGLVTQEVQLFEASLRENLTFFDPTVADERLHAVLELLGMGPWVDSLPLGLETPISGASMSAGEAQLLAFARVFLHNPGLVILDEASSRLDPATEALLDRAVQRLLQGRTAIIIAHRLATVEQVDEILVLEGGRKLEHGPREALAADPGSHFARLRRAGMEEVLL